MNDEQLVSSNTFITFTVNILLILQSLECLLQCQDLIKPVALSAIITLPSFVSPHASAVSSCTFAQQNLE